MNVLFVCTLNVARSVAAERLYRRTPGMSVRSAGISPRAHRQVTAADVARAERIVVFEEAHTRHLVRAFGPDIGGPHACQGPQCGALKPPAAVTPRQVAAWIEEALAEGRLPVEGGAQAAVRTR